MEYNEKIFRKQSARKGFVIDTVNDTASKLVMHTRRMAEISKGELLTSVEILETILKEKLSITQIDIDQIKTRIHERNKRDNTLLDKYWKDNTKNPEERLELMKKEGLSDQAFNEIKNSIASNNQVVLDPAPPSSASESNKENIPPQ